MAIFQLAICRRLQPALLRIDLPQSTLRVDRMLFTVNNAPHIDQKSFPNSEFVIKII